MKAFFNDPFTPFWQMAKSACLYTEFNLFVVIKCGDFSPCFRLYRG